MRQLIEIAAKNLGVKVTFDGARINERGVVTYIEGDEAPAIQVVDAIVRPDRRYFFRPAEVNPLPGDPSKAQDKLNWVPNI